MVTKTYTYGDDVTDFEPKTYGVNDSTDPVLIGKVAFQIIKEVVAKDPLGVFDKMPVENGDTIEQTVVKLAESTAYDPTGANVLAPDTANRLAVRYFNDWTHYKYKATVYDEEYRKFMNPERSAQEVANKLVSSLSQSDIHDKFKSNKGLLEYARVNGVFVKAETVAYSGTAGTPDYKGILKAIKNAVKGMSFVNDDFNTASLERSTNLDDIYIIMSYKLKNALDVDELAGVFNLDKTELGRKIIEIDTDTITAVDGTSPYVIYIVDQNAILNYTRLYKMTEPVHNTDGDFWNYYLHCERMFAVSQLFDGCYILANTKAPVVEG